MIEDATVVVTEIEIEKEEEVDQDHTPEDTEDKKDDQGRGLGSNQDDIILEKKLDTKGADHDQSQIKDAEACRIIRQMVKKRDSRAYHKKPTMKKESQIEAGVNKKESQIEAGVNRKESQIKAGVNRNHNRNKASAEVKVKQNAVIVQFIVEMQDDMN